MPNNIVDNVLNGTDFNIPSRADFINSASAILMRREEEYLDILSLYENYEAVKDITVEDKLSTLSDLKAGIERYMNKYKGSRRTPAMAGLLEQIDQVNTNYDSYKKNNYQAAAVPVDKNLHLVWIGGGLGSSQESYMHLWEKINPDYKITLWYDSDALLAAETKKSIENHVKKTLFGQLDVDVKDHHSTQEFFYQYSSQVTEIQNEMSSSVVGRKLTDADRINFLVDRLGLDRTELEGKLATNRANINRFNRANGSVTTVDVNPLVNEAGLQSTYQQEIDKRHNFAGAGDMVRLLALQKKGGVYADMDMQPGIDKALVRQIFEGIEKPVDLKQVEWDMVKLQAILNADPSWPANLTISKKYDSLSATLKETLATAVDQSPISQLTDAFTRLGDINIHPDGFWVAAMASSQSSNPSIINQVVAGHKNSNAFAGLIERIKTNYSIFESIKNELGYDFINSSPDRRHRTQAQFNEVTAIIKRHYPQFDGIQSYNLALALFDYRKDGLSPEARSTIFITGPTIYRAEGERISREVIQVSPSMELFVFDRDKVNQLTEEELTSSWQMSGQEEKWLAAQKQRYVREYLADWQNNQQHIDQFQQRLSQLDPYLKWRPAPQSILTINAQSTNKTPNTRRNGLCTAIALAWSHATKLDSQDTLQNGKHNIRRTQQLLDNLYTVGAIRSEQLASSVSDNDRNAANKLLNDLITVNQQQSSRSALPDGLAVFSRNVRTASLARRLNANKPTGTDTYLLSTPNHTMAMTVAYHDRDWDIRLIDPTVGEVANIKDPIQLQALLTQHLTDLSSEYQYTSGRLLVEKIDHQALAANADLNNLITPHFEPIEITLEKLRKQDTSQGRITIDGQDISRVELYHLGAQINGKPIDATVDFNQASTLSNLTLRHDKVQAYLKGQDSTLVSKTYQVVEAISTQRTAAGQSPDVIINDTNPGHWIVEQHQQASATLYRFKQAKQTLSTAREQGLTVELSPMGEKHQSSPLTDLLAVAHSEQTGDVHNLLANRNRAAFIDELISQGRANSAEKTAIADFKQGQSQLSALSQRASLLSPPSRLSIHDISTRVNTAGDHSFVLKNGNQQFLVSKRNGSLSFYDPRVGWVSGFADAPALQTFMTDHFSDLTKLHYGMATGTFEVREISPLFFNDAAATEATALIKQVLPVEAEALSKLDLQKGPFLIDGQQISRTTLWQMGAKLDGSPVTATSFQGDWQSRISFDPIVLKQHLRAVPDADFRQSLETLQTLLKQGRQTPTNLVEVNGLSSGMRGLLNRLASPATVLSTPELTTMRKKVGGRRQVSAGSAATNISGVGLQAFGIYSGLKGANDAFKRGDLTEGFIQMGAVSAEIASIPLEIALERSLPKLGQRIVAYSAGNTGRFASTSSRLGSTLGRSAGAVASLITLPFDIYSAIKAFSDAGAAGLSAKQRQDLYFQGGMSVAGATVSLGLGVAAALSTTAAAYAGPIGIAVGIAFVIGSQIYSAVRQVEDVMEFVELDGLQRLRQGWLAFWGREMDQWVTDAAKAGNAEQVYVKRVREQSQQMLDGALGQSVGAIVYGNVKAQINPTKVWDIEGNYTIERLTEVVGSNDTIDVRHGFQQLRNVVHKGSHLAAEKAILFNIGDGDDKVDGMNNHMNRFVFGKGLKQLTGGTLADSFTFSASQKTISNFAASLNPDGSLKNPQDKLLFNLNGGAGEDTLVLSADTFNRYAQAGSDAQRFSGFVVDLAAGHVWLRNYGQTGNAAKGASIGLLTSIEHTAGSGTGLSDSAIDRGYSDIIYGSSHSNSIVANFNDQVFGRGGNDLITLTDRATADGGAGQDVYMIQRGVKQATIHEDGQDASVIRFDYSLEEIKNWQRVGSNLVITFEPSFGSLERTVTVQGVYGESLRVRQAEARLPGERAEPGELILINDKLSFQTRDGFMLLPQLARTIPAAQASETESINLTTRYLKTGDQVYRDDPGGITIDLRDNRIDGDNLTGQHRDQEIVNLDKNSLIVLADNEDHIGAPVGSNYFIERGQGPSTITPRAQTRARQRVNTIYLDYDVAEIQSIQSRYNVVQFQHGYQRKDFSLVFTMTDGRKHVLANIIDTTTHVMDALARGGKTLRNYKVITRDGTEYALRDDYSVMDQHNSKSLATERHYADQRYSGPRHVDTRHTLNTKDYTLTDWQWGDGKWLDNRYQLSAEGTSGSDKLHGSDNADIMRGYDGEDYMQGRDGHDIYMIGASEGTVTINNKARDGKLDSLVLSTSLDQVTTHRNGMDLLITAQLARPLPNGQTESVSRQIRISDYFFSEDNRHLNIVTNEGIRQEVTIDDLGNISRLYMAPSHEPGEPDGISDESVVELITQSLATMGAEGNASAITQVNNPATPGMSSAWAVAIN